MVIIDEIEITIKIFASVSSTYDFVLAVLRDEKEKRIQRGCEDSSGGSKEEEIMEQCKLDSTVLENYLSALAELRLLMVEEKDETFYRTTEKGLDFLRIYHRLRWLLWGKDNDFLLMRLLGQLGKVKKDVHPFYVS